jgi:hypothetical protein
VRIITYIGRGVGESASATARVLYFILIRTIHRKYGPVKGLGNSQKGLSVNCVQGANAQCIE